MRGANGAMANPCLYGFGDRARSLLGRGGTDPRCRRERPGALDLRILARNCTKCDTAGVIKVAFIGTGCLALTLAAAAVPARASTAAGPGHQGVAAPSGSGVSPESGVPRAGTPRLPPPRHQGTLRVTGTLRDGGTVRAGGLSWRPGTLPPGDRLLSFEVGYYWSACTAAGQCRRAADTTATPFAARRYVAGHADTGRFLKLTETATEVVETSPATFSFSVKSASVSRMASGKVRAYRAGRPPSSEFVNGTPERRTASAAL